MVHFTPVDIVGIEAFSSLLVVSLIVSFATWTRSAWRRRRPPLTYWPAPEQHRLDELLERVWRVRVGRNRKAVRAARLMDQWHRDPRGEGCDAKVVPLRRARR